MEVTCCGVVHLVCGNLQHKQHILFHDLEFIMYANIIATCSCQCGAYLSVIGQLLQSKFPSIHLAEKSTSFLNTQ